MGQFSKDGATEVGIVMIGTPGGGVAARFGEIVSAGESPTTRYPAELACEVTTQLGTNIHLRPILPDDGPGLVDFHQHLSPQSIYRRFFFVHPMLTSAEVERFTCVDYLDRVAFIAEDGSRLVAVCRYERIPGTDEAEVAFVVADQYQHHGIGTMLLGKLADAAWQRGITTFTATTLAENRDMLDIFFHSGFQVSTNSECGTVSVRFPIGPDDAYRRPAGPQPEPGPR